MQPASGRQLALFDLAPFRRVSRSAERVLRLIVAYSKGDWGVCHAKQETLAGKLGLSVRSIAAAIAELKRAGCILVHRHGSRGASYRAIAAETPAETPVEISIEPVEMPVQTVEIVSAVSEVLQIDRGLYLLTETTTTDEAGANRKGAIVEKRRKRKHSEGFRRSMKDALPEVHPNIVEQILAESIEYGMSDIATANVIESVIRAAARRIKQPENPGAYLAVSVRNELRKRSRGVPRLLGAPEKAAASTGQETSGDAMAGVPAAAGPSMFDLPPIEIVSEFGRRIPNPEFFAVQSALRAAEDRIRRAANPAALERHIIRETRERFGLLKTG